MSGPYDITWLQWLVFVLPGIAALLIITLIALWLKGRRKP
jgi:hypothetical protein